MTTQPTASEYATLAQAIAAVAAPGWREITYVHQNVGGAFAESMTCVTATGEVRVPPPRSREFFMLMADLRSRMYQPGLGTWFTATFRITSDGRISADFDYDHEPAYDFAEDSWAVDAEKFPRTPENTPAWLAQKVGQATWSGARWQIDLTPDGTARDTSRRLDATTTPQARDWAATIADRLRVAGLRVEQGTDVGEDREGRDVEYVELRINVGEGYMALAFWRDMIFWGVDVFADQVDETTFTAAARAVLTAVRDTTGYAPGTQLTPYERRLLGLEE